MSLVFNGRAFAQQKEKLLALEVGKLNRNLRVKSFTFIEDAGSVMYTRLKTQAATRIGISYESVEHSIKDDPKAIALEIYEAGKDPVITGVMIQKPSAAVFGSSFPVDWWGQLISVIEPTKDVDCLTPVNLSAIKKGEFKILPATVQAVLSILDQAKQDLNVPGADWRQMSVAIVGRSDIVGKPLSWVLETKHNKVELFGRDNLPRDLSGFDIVISAVGKPNLISGDRLKEGGIVIDVGSPKGDIEFETAVVRSAFITPVPGGVGPVTVVSLMENCVETGRKL